jgi:hypothetical protein
LHVIYKKPCIFSASFSTTPFHEGYSFVLDVQKMLQSMKTIMELGNRVNMDTQTLKEFGGEGGGLNEKIEKSTLSNHSSHTITEG